MMVKYKYTSLPFLRLALSQNNLVHSSITSSHQQLQGLLETPHSAAPNRAKIQRHSTAKADPTTNTNNLPPAPPKMPTIAFFGATGDCAGYCLAACLNAGYTCTALARNASKLTASMQAKGVTPETLARHLTIIEGNVKDLSAVKQTLQPPPGSNPVDKIVSGIGGTDIKMQWSLRKPATLIDPTICQDAGTNILLALKELQPATKPFLINVSTTGISPKGTPRDVPLLFAPLYHWLGQDMHGDKKVLQDKLAEHVQLPEYERGVWGYVNVKASLLMDGEGKGLQAVREGVEERPAVGYTIQRKDVGEWMFERLVRGEVRGKWVNGSVTVTY